MVIKDGNKFVGSTSLEMSLLIATRHAAYRGKSYKAVYNCKLWRIFKLNFGEITFL
jgi:hypothetical protein